MKKKVKLETIFLNFQGYFESLRNEKLGTPLQITLLCPGPVFSNFLQESFTENPGEVSKIMLEFMKFSMENYIYVVFFRNMENLWIKMIKE